MAGPCVQSARVLTDLVAAGAGAGVAAGFGAPMSGVLFAVETVLFPTSKQGAAFHPDKHDDESGVLIASVLVACVCAAIVSQAGLGLEPAFQIPPTAPLSIPELPLCVIEGLLCGSAAAGLGLAASNSEASFVRLRKAGVPSTLMPVIGGLACGSLAVLFPEITYQGFDNFNALFQFDGRQAVEHTGAGLAALVLVKIAGTAVCRGSGLVGGVYAPSLFIGAALGAAFWHLADASMVALASAAPSLHMAPYVVELASPNTYALVGAAAMLAAYCQVPLTSVLLLFELTQDYTLVLPTLMAVGFAQWGARTAPKLFR
jgi:H+/Cl- antiporter ClcA